jgi:predicted P-loop ATPase
MLATAVVNRFHPVRDWLSSLRWDGVKRIDNWLVNAFGCDKTQYHSAVGVKFLIASVRRILQPGTKFDYLLVLEGPQGIGKSTALRELFLIKWFSDSIPPDLRSRDAAIALQDVWCLEFAEIEHLIRSDPETIKAFLSRSVDRYRPVYGKSYVERPRQGVLVGTTNASEWLRDFTGNRRIWPVKCPVADPLWVSVNVEQLWAEAVIREASGETIWLDDECASSEAVVAQVDRLIEDVWSDAVVTWLRSGGYREVKTADVLTHALSLPKDRQDRRAEYRVTAIMTGEGWTKVVKKTKDRKSYKAWVIQDGR